MRIQTVLRVSLVVFLLVPFPLTGCGESEEPNTSPPAPASFAGTYDVTGVTTEQPSGTRRRIGGRVVVNEASEGYSSSFSLKTEFVTPEGPVKAELIGTGVGQVERDRLVGTAETQLILGGVPGIDPKFPWIPHRLGPRVVSNFSMRADPDGTYGIEISTQPAAGETYAPTVTSMRALPTAEAGPKPQP